MILIFPTESTEILAYNLRRISLKGKYLQCVYNFLCNRVLCEFELIIQNECTYICLIKILPHKYMYVNMYCKIFIQTK